MSLKRGTSIFSHQHEHTKCSQKMCLKMVWNRMRTRCTFMRSSPSRLKHFKQHHKGANLPECWAKCPSTSACSAKAGCAHNKGEHVHCKKKFQVRNHWHLQAVPLCTRCFPMVRVCMVYMNSSASITHHCIMNFWLFVACISSLIYLHLNV